jgi:hypothetical protein
VHGRPLGLSLALASLSLLAAAGPASALPGWTGRFLVTVEGTYTAQGQVNHNSCYLTPDAQSGVPASGTATETTTFRSTRALNLTLAKYSPRFPFEFRASDDRSGFRPGPVRVSLNRQSSLRDGSTPRQCFLYRGETSPPPQDCGPRTGTAYFKPSADGIRRPIMGFGLMDAREQSLRDFYRACPFPGSGTDPPTTYLGDTPRRVPVSVNRLFTGPRRQVVVGTTTVRRSAREDEFSTFSYSYTLRWKLTLVRVTRRQLR